MALYHMCIASPEFCSDTFTSLCNAMLHARGEAAVLAALEPIYSAGGAEGLAATYLTNVSASIARTHGARIVKMSSILPCGAFMRTSRLLSHFLWVVVGTDHVIFAGHGFPPFSLGIRPFSGSI